MRIACLKEISWGSGEKRKTFTAKK